MRNALPKYAKRFAKTTQKKNVKFKALNMFQNVCTRSSDIVNTSQNV